MSFGDAFAVTESSEDETLVISVYGEIDMSTGPELRVRLETAQQSGLDVVVDLTGVSFIDSTGLGILVVAADRLRAQGRGFRMLVSASNVMRVFEITGLVSALAIESVVTTES